jgi:hypothetical protein
MAIPPEGATVVGMVGATPIPIVQLGEGTRLMVKKKRGRFTLLQEAPITATAPVVATTVSSETPAVTHIQPSVENRERTYSGSESVISNASSYGTTSTATTANHSHQTFAGTGAPVVTRKGRFFVTNLKDPSFIAVNFNPQMAKAVVPVQTMLAPAPSVTPPAEPFPSDSTAASLSPSHQLPPSVVHQASLPQTAGAPQYGVQQYVAPQGVVQPVAVQQGVVPQPAALPQSAGPQPGVAQEYGIANVDDQNEMAAKTAKSQARRHASVPGSRPLGVAGQTGLGKVFYFLDQMRLEVADADRTIKSLQAEMKFLVSSSWIHFSCRLVSSFQLQVN